MTGSEPYGRPSSGLCCDKLIAALGLPATVTTPGPLSVREMLRALRCAGARPELAVCQSLEDLALYSEDDAILIALVDAGVLWAWRAAQSPGVANHAVVLRVVHRDEADEAVTGALVEDPAQPAATVLMDARTLIDAWLRPGGLLIVTHGADIRR